MGLLVIERVGRIGRLCSCRCSKEMGRFGNRKMRVFFFVFIYFFGVGEEK